MRLFALCKIVRILSQIAIVLMVLLCSPMISICAETETQAKSSQADIIRNAAAEGKIAFKLTTPEELKAVPGPASKETTESDGGMEVLDLSYSDIRVRFGRMRSYSTAFTVLWINVKGKSVDIGQEKQIVLQNEDDLKKFDPKMIVEFWRQTAIQTDVGLVINPVGFIEAVRKLNVVESK